MNDQLVTIKKFSGLNTRDAPGFLGDNELVECQNYNVGPDGELSKRSGIKELDVISAGHQVTLIGTLTTNVFSHVIARVGNDLYWSDDSTTWHLIAGGPYNNVEWGVQYIDVFYIVRRDDVIVSWDGMLATELADTPTGTCAAVFKDRLFVINSSGASGSRLYYSEIADFTNFSTLGTFVDVSPGDGDVVIAFAILQGNFVIFKTMSIWILYVSADLESWELRQVTNQLGCLSKHTVKEYQGSIVFLSNKGVMQTDLSSFTELSVKVHPVFRNQLVDAVSLSQSCAALWDGYYILLLQTFSVAPTWNSVSGLTWNDLSNQPWNAQNAAYTWLVYNFESGAWAHWLPGDSTMSCYTFLEVAGPVSLRGLYMGSRVNDGRVYRYGDSTFLDGVNSSYEGVIETKDFDFGTPYAKRGTHLWIERQGSGPLDLSYIRDEVATVLQVIVDESTEDFGQARQDKPFHGPGFFQFLKFRVSNDKTGPEVFYGFTLAIKPRNKSLKGL